MKWLQPFAKVIPPSAAQPRIQGQLYISIKVNGACPRRTRTEQNVSVRYTCLFETHFLLSFSHYVQSTIIEIHTPSMLLWINFRGINFHL